MASLTEKDTPEQPAYYKTDAYGAIKFPGLHAKKAKVCFFCCTELFSNIEYIKCL